MFYAGRVSYIKDCHYSFNTPDDKFPSIRDSTKLTENINIFCIISAGWSSNTEIWIFTKIKQHSFVHICSAKIFVRLFSKKSELKFLIFNNFHLMITFLRRVDRTKILAGQIVVKHTPLKNQRKGSGGADYRFFKIFIW